MPIVSQARSILCLRSKFFFSILYFFRYQVRDGVYSLLGVVDTPGPSSKLEPDLIRWSPGFLKCTTRQKQNSRFFSFLFLVLHTASARPYSDRLFSSRPPRVCGDRLSCLAISVLFSPSASSQLSQCSQLALGGVNTHEICSPNFFKDFFEERADQYSMIRKRGCVVKHFRVSEDPRIKNRSNIPLAF